jgi:hypothetical protein
MKHLSLCMQFFNSRTMVTKAFLSIIAILSLTNAFGQEQIWTKQTKMSDVLSFEKGINPNSKILYHTESLSKDYYPLVDKYQIANPIIVQREPLLSKK